MMWSSTEMIFGNSTASPLPLVSRSITDLPPHATIYACTVCSLCPQIGKDAGPQGASPEPSSSA
jgi:hypothetical protein